MDTTKTPRHKEEELEKRPASSVPSCLGGSKPLPPGWRWVRLGEVCIGVTSRDPGREPDAPFRYIEISSIDTQTKRIVSARTLIGKNTPNRARQLVHAQDVLVATTRPNLNTVALVPEELHESIASTGFCLLRCGPELLPDYLFHFVQLPDFIQALTDLTKGSTYPAVTDGQVRRQEIPLPPLAEQRRIAGILKEQMAAVERARAAARAKLDAIKALPAAFLRQVFPQPGQPLPPGWRWVRLGEVCVQDRLIVEARSPDAANLPYLGLEDVESQTGRILKTSPQPDEGDGVSTTFRFTPEHVLYSKLRPYLNKVALPEFEGRCTTEMIPLRCGQQICREFLALILRRPETVEHAMRGKTGSRMPRADMDHLLQLEIPLPPLAEQRRIAAILREQMAVVERARAAVEAELEAIQALPAALLRRAFSGEL